MLVQQIKNQWRIKNITVVLKKVSQRHYLHDYKIVRNFNTDIRSLNLLNPIQFSSGVYKIHKTPWPLN